MGLYLCLLGSCANGQNSWQQNPVLGHSHHGIQEVERRNKETTQHVGCLSSELLPSSQTYILSFTTPQILLSYYESIKGFINPPYQNLCDLIFSGNAIIDTPRDVLYGSSRHYSI